MSATSTRQVTGAVLRPVVFEPTSNKWQQRPCNGFQIHVTAPDRYQPYLTTLGLIQAVLANHRQDFDWKPPPYEYEFERMPIDLISGDQKIRQRLENLASIDEMEKDWQEELKRFSEISREFHLYD